MTVVNESRKSLSNRRGFIESAKVRISFGAFMNLSVTVLVDPSKDALKGIAAGYASGRNKKEALAKALEKLNSSLPRGAEVVEFETGTYVTPVTRRTYAVAVAVYNAPIEKKPLSEYTLKERRELLASVLERFDYNPKVLNISEVARVFNVSRDSIYYDIEQILKAKKS